MIDMQALHAAKRRERLPKGLVVKLTGDGRTEELCFADIASRDEFMARAQRLSKAVEVVRCDI
jgi:hypothetical protein